MDVKFVKPDDIHLKVKMRIDYEDALARLAQGFVMLLRCDRKKASYIKKRLDTKAKEKLGQQYFVDHDKAIYRGEEYYAFYLSKIEMINVE